MTVDKELPPTPKKSWLPFSLSIFALPPWTFNKDARFFGIPKKTLIVLAAAVALVFLALLLGLSLGLTIGRKHSNDKDTPVPPSSSTLQTGDATYYEPGLGACGITSTSEDDIAAISQVVFDAAQVGANPNTNPLCGRKIWVTRQRTAGEKNVSLEVTVVDRCTGCKPQDLDFSISVFEKLAEEWQGRVLISWAWIV